MIRVYNLSIRNYFCSRVLHLQKKYFCYVHQRNQKLSSILSPYLPKLLDCSSTLCDYKIKLYLMRSCCSTQFKCTDSEISDEEDDDFDHLNSSVAWEADLSVINNKDEDYKSYIAHIFTKLFECDTETANTIVSKNRTLVNYPATSLKKNYLFLKHKGFEDETIKQNGWLLTIQPEKYKTFKNQINKLRLGNIKESFPLLALSETRLKKFCSIIENDNESYDNINRFQYTLEKLECTITELCQLFATFPFLSRIPFYLYQEKMDLLLDSGFPKPHIRNDMWIFQCSVAVLKSRIKRLKDLSLLPKKPWILRCPDEIFDRSVKRRLDRRKIIDDEVTVTDYLCDRLGCDASTMKYLCNKTPQLLNTNIPKIKGVLDFLFEQGFSTQQVIEVPRILCNSLERTKRRLFELKQIKYKPISLIVLCWSEKQYKKLLTNINDKKEMPVINS